MGDAGEGLIDADARIQERMEELERDRAVARKREPRDPAHVKARESLESLKLARIALEAQLAATPHERRRAQIAQAIEELDRRMAEVHAVIA
jgi:hypothetical protein